jgi:tetraacyldisaccharide 4'-kinase
VIETHGFSDHHLYKIEELENLYQIAKERNATLVTTRKDWVKFPRLFQEKITHLDIELEFDNKELIKNELNKIL